MPADPLQRIEGKYEILSKLKEGGMGAIYKVRHRLLDEVRVIKLMRPQLTENADLRARFVREARFAIQLRHPNVAQLYDFTVDEEDGTAFIVMEFIDGMTLDEILGAHGPPPLGLTLEIAQQSLRALGYLHGKGFIHRDISPDNLILTSGADGEPLVKLIDLGIAKAAGGGEGLTQTGTFLGKVRYASPEQFSTAGPVAIDGRGDLYSFGIVLYELLTGKNPIQGRDPSSLIAAHLFRPPLDFAESDPQGRVPQGLREAVLTALAKSADDRFATAQDFSRALAAFRSPADLDEVSLRRFLRRPPPAPRGARAQAGTTQDHLDQQFGLEVTPSRGGLAGPTPTPATAPAAPRGSTVAHPPTEPEAPPAAETRVLQGTPPPTPEEPGEKRGFLPQAESDRQPGPPSESRSAPVWALAALLAVGVLAGLGWLFTHRASSLPPAAVPAPSPAPASPPAAAPAPPAPPMTPVTPKLGGPLQVDVLPWGEVVEIRDAQGTKVPFPVPAITPLVLNLPAGRYTIRLENPAFPKPLDLAAEVSADPSASKRVRGEFRRVDVDDYLKGMGW